MVVPAKKKAPTPSTVRKAVLAAAMGNCVEWYDFGVFAYMAVTIGHVFFPSGNESLQLVEAFMAFAAAFLVRPFGGMFFGPLGDKVGRQKVLVFTLLLMSASTVALGLLPGYATIGIAAPILLVAIRMLQGFSTGGEYGGAATFIAEYAPDKRRGFLCSWLEFGTLTGYVLGAGTSALLTTALSEGAMHSWGWRIPFLIGGPLGLIGLYLRYKLEDTPAFADLKEHSEVAKSPVRELLSKHLRSVLICVGIVTALSVADYVLLTYMPSYLTDTLDMDKSTGLLLSVGVMLVMMSMVVPLGALSDRVGRKPVQLAGAIGFLVVPLPAFALINQKSAGLVFAGMLMLGVCLVCFLATIPSSLPALFPTAIRYGAFAISYNVAVSLFGGPTPAVVEALTSWTGNHYVPAFYIMAAVLVAFIPILKSPETAGQPLLGGHAAVPLQRQPADNAVTPEKPQVKS